MNKDQLRLLDIGIALAIATPIIVFLLLTTDYYKIITAIILTLVLGTLFYYATRKDKA